MDLAILIIPSREKKSGSVIASMGRFILTHISTKCETMVLI